MARHAFDRELRFLQDEMLALGRVVQEALTESVEILLRRDTAAARRLIDRDARIDGRRFAIEADTLGLIATQQPVASGLRVLGAVLEIVIELERIGDCAKGIARSALMIGEGVPLEPLVDIPRMAARVRGMLDRALGAFVQGDVALARSIPREDDETDRLCSNVYRELLGAIIADPQVIDRAPHLLWVVHNLERASDRVTNICERVIHTVTGELADMDVREQFSSG